MHITLILNHLSLLSFIHFLIDPIKAFEYSFNSKAEFINFLLMEIKFCFNFKDLVAPKIYLILGSVLENLLT